MRWWLAAAVVFAGCTSTPAETASAADVGVQVVCSDQFEPSACPAGDLRLEIGDQGWSLPDGSGSAIVPSTTNVSVRVVEAESCLVLVEFAAEPAHEYLVQLATDGHATAVDLAHEDVAFEWGPGLLEVDRSSC